MSTPSTISTEFASSQCSLCPQGSGSNVLNDDTVCLCPTGYYKNGNTCTACTSCESGQYTTSVCTGSTTTDTQSCTTCLNGGSSYSCPSGKYVTGNACAGNGDTDTQTCNDCVTGKYQTQNVKMKRRCKTCSFGQSATSAATAACSVCASGQSQEKGKTLFIIN